MSQQWHKWGYWDSSTGSYQRFRGNTYCYARSFNLHLIGDHSNGKIYKASRSVYTDNGNPIRSLLRTGHISHGYSGAKQSDIVRLHCKRGVGNESVENPQISMRRRVNNRAQFGNERMKSLGRTGQQYPFIDWGPNGTYRTCQYEFVHSDDTDLVIMGAQEYIEGLS
jgi:hypothetical protein